MKSTSRLKFAATVLSVVRASSRPGAPNVLERAQCVPRLVRATLDGSYAGTTKGRLALVAAAAAYVASPVDLVPESVLPVVGLADDAVVLTWAVRTLVEETDRFLAWEAGQGARSHPPRTPRSAGSGPAAARGRDAWGRPVPRADRDVTGAARTAARARGAAADFVLESVRRRLER